MSGVERLQVVVKTKLVLQRRIPKDFSATQAEHMWHGAGAADIDVTSATAAEAFEHADVLRAAAPDRRDEEYRVVLVTTETTAWVLG